MTKTLSQDRKFGTDGIRGPVDTTMNPLFVTKLGWAAGSVLKEEGISRVLIGKDTRISGYMLESALQAGFISAGMDVTLLGPLPTPAVAYLAKKYNQAGVVISASHNLFEDNGIKFFTKDGHKFSFDLEQRIELKITQLISTVKSIKLGKANRLNDAQQQYVEFCKSSTPSLDLSNVSILLDCANGATYSVAPKVFRDLGANVKTIGADPDGININQNCGSTSPDFLAGEMAKGTYDIGIAFDGDGDRILIVGKSGKVLDGDDLLYILTSASSHRSEDFHEKGVVGTLMTNKALENHFKDSNIKFIRTDVGDKHVLEELLRKRWSIGGEPSGHIICLDSSSTGDAVIAALKILEHSKDQAFDVEKILHQFERFPQTLINIKVEDVNEVIMNNSFRTALKETEASLGDLGRVLIRPSGTEPLIRIMVESKNADLADESARSLADLASSI
ncbi:phosphoglucosamine mutase [Gammaproteobacteria bacterium]|nr:phosphoglucosamine mutase [Gammaproteobacteria bacterium]